MLTTRPVPDEFYAAIRPVIAREAMRYHVRQAQRGDTESLEAVVLSNLSFIVRQAKKITRSTDIAPDIVQAGVCGLIHAIPRWRFKKAAGGMFLTYAAYWIRVFMIDELATTRHSIIISPHIYERTKRLTGTPVSPPSIVSLDSLGLQNPKGWLPANITKAVSKNPEAIEVVAHLDARRLAGDALSGLHPKEAMILRLHYMEGWTLAQIGGKLGVCRERVRQIQVDALCHARWALGGLSALQTVRGVLAELDEARA